MINNLIAIFTANFVFIGLKAFQQMNVVHSAKMLVFVTSHAMAVVEVYLIAEYAAHGPAWPVVLTVGLSGGLGSVAAIMLRKKLFRHNSL